VSPRLSRRHWVVDAQPPLSAARRDAMTRAARMARHERITRACRDLGIPVRSRFASEAEARAFAARIRAQLPEEPYVGETLSLAL